MSGLLSNNELIDVADRIIIASKIIDKKSLSDFIVLAKMATSYYNLYAFHNEFLAEKCATTRDELIEHVYASLVVINDMELVKDIPYDTAYIAKLVELAKVSLDAFNLCLSIGIDEKADPTRKINELGGCFAGIYGKLCNALK